MAHKKHELPGWFPFALGASFLVMIGAGIKSNWGRAKPPSPLQQGGVLQDWLGGSSSRWFFWYILPRGATEYATRGPEHLTDQGAFQLEFETKTASLGVQLYRFVWIPDKGIWVYDTRNDPGLLASREIRDQQGNVVG
jgi:hypothetical protein